MLSRHVQCLFAQPVPAQGTSAFDRTLVGQLAHLDSQFVRNNTILLTDYFDS